MDCPHRIGQKKTVYVLDIRSIVGPRFVKIEKTLCRQLGGFCAFCAFRMSGVARARVL